MSSSEFFSSPTFSQTNSPLELLSQSGFNTLHTTQRDGKRLCVKSLSQEYVGNPLYESLLRKEFEIGYMLDHPHICRTYSMERFDPLGNAIVMEWIDGRTLDKFIAEGNHTHAELVRITTQLCEAIDYAHKKQVLHRDLKPTNIIVTYNGDNVKVIDFGLSDTDSHTSLKEPAGSRRYASPELLQGEKVDTRSDIYSVGVIMSELFGQNPPRRIDKIVSQATAFTPSKRYGNVEEIISAIQLPRKMAWSLPILIAILISLGYLFYSSWDSLSRKEYAQALIPSAEVDRVSEEEFARRKEINTHFYDVINERYVSLMHDNIYNTSCATPQLPDIAELQATYLTQYKHIIDTTFASIKGSSLHTTALRNHASHNNEMFTIMRNQFPAMFWIKTEALFRNASDSVALRLKRIAAPKRASNFSELTFDEQQSENDRYNEAIRHYKASTIKVWAEHYRRSRNLSTLPPEITQYFQE